MDAFRLDGVSFRYRGQERPALAGVSLAAAPGERLGIIGLTGAGKSTLLRLLNRTVPVGYKGDFSGRVFLFDEDTAGRRPSALAAIAGLVFQDFESQLFSSAAELDVAFGPENLGLSSADIRARVTAALAAVGLAGFERRDPATLSGGQQQRLAIATVLALNPRLLCLDEPTTDLDPQGRAEVSSLLGRLAGGGMTVAIAEHEAELLVGLDRIVGLADGKVIIEADGARALADAGLLRSLGVRPPDAVALAERLSLTGLPADPVVAAAAVRAAGFSVRPGAGENFLRADQAAAAATGAAVIETDGREHVYRSGQGLRGVSLSVQRGEFVALLGRNGSGKTTMVKHFNGLLQPTAGEVRIDGQPAARLKPGELGRRIGFVFQDPDHQIFAGRVADEVAFAPRNYGLSEAEVSARVTRALALVDLAGAADADPFVLTKGERQRVALASVLAAEPEVLILDEPTTGLDYSAQLAVMELLADLNRQGRTIIVITHAIWVAAEFARRVVVLDGGRILADGPARAVLSDPTLMAAAGLATPGAAAISAEMGGAALALPALTVAELASCLERR